MTPRLSWLRPSLATEPDASGDLSVLRERFACFLALLERNNQVLATIADMEEKTRGEHLFDATYVRASAAGIRAGVKAIVDQMIAIGGAAYAPLAERWAHLDAEVEALLAGSRPVPCDDYVIPLAALDAGRAPSVGSKSAQLGELKSRLGLPVPDGFAISAWAYKRFVDANDLQARITGRISTVDIKRHEDLLRVSADIHATIEAAPVPADVADAIRDAAADLIARTGARFVSLRSSAIGEDALFSFAGQYASFLNVAADEIVDHYRQVLAGKFSPRAIYYLLSHALSESDLAMAVSCVEMVDATASGVAYTRDPVHPDDDAVLISAVYGLGELLVAGTVTPDVFRVSRETGAVLASTIAHKPVRLVADAAGGTRREPVPLPARDAPAVRPEQLATLARHAASIEAHYGCPQDIEWAADGSGRLFLLQARPLRIVPAPRRGVRADLAARERLRTGGVTVSPGAAAGPIHHAGAPQDLAMVPDGAVLVAPSPFAGITTVFDRIHALITETGGVASHVGTVARESRVPALSGVDRAASLPAGEIVTVDATDANVYRGVVPELIDARRPDVELFEGSGAFTLLERVLARISPLNLMHPSDPAFTPEHCRTLHDITRFAHQRAMEEIFSKATTIEHTERLGAKLKSAIPLDVYVLCLDRPVAAPGARRALAEDELLSEPMRAFWGGVKQEGWVSEARAGTAGGLMSVLATHLSTREQDEFSECSFAILSREYMVLSLRMGYHFTTIEAMCTPEPGKNYIRMQHKGGGASLDRRIRRVELIKELLAKLGFEHAGAADFLDSAVSYLDAAATSRVLELLGRVTMLTKQLDIALSNDAIARWYTDDIARKLGL